jgi:hypothetical protein
VASDEKYTSSTPRVNGIAIFLIGLHAGEADMDGIKEE